jgi:UDP-N-acetylglucosamine--N-acetylmuramyl-(pentapeptide) pyrophosphoryl-undecaprenol N-acetylglucosamine transferase
VKPAHFIFAGGGTGGHLFPGIAVADALRRLLPAAHVTFLTTDRPLDRELLAPGAFAQIPQPVRPFSPRPWDWPAFGLAWSASRRQAGRLIQQLRPRAVLGLGGYAAGPAVVSAARAGVRTAILNPDATPGRANRFLSRRVDLVVLQWEAARRHFSARIPCAALGCPIRAEFAQAAATAAAGRARFELAEDRPVLLVTGASQGARTVNEALLRVWPEFHALQPEWQLLHLTGSADEAAVRRGYEQAGAPARVLAFTHEMPLALAAADLVISRAGASTLAELTALGRPSILLPYPYHRDQHQRHNAEVLVEAGAALCLEDRREPAANAGPLLAALRACAPHEARERMSAAARRLGRIDAAERVAAWLVDERN